MKYSDTLIYLPKIGEILKDTEIDQASICFYLEVLKSAGDACDAMSKYEKAVKEVMGD